MDQSLQTTPSGLSRKSIIVRLVCAIVRYRDTLLRQQIDGAVKEVPGVDILKGSGHVDNGPFAGVT
jgi:hypothetical protein